MAEITRNDLIPGNDIYAPNRISNIVNKSGWKVSCNMFKSESLYTDGGLVLAGGHGVVDVLVGDGLGVEALPHPANAVFQHLHIGDGLLGGEGAPTGPSGPGAFGPYVQKPIPPFRRTARRYFAFGRAWGRAGGSGRG